MKVKAIFQGSRLELSAEGDAEDITIMLINVIRNMTVDVVFSDDLDADDDISGGETLN